ncbi:probable ATP-dependent RNA helicase DDX27 [Lytechinus variegatus]|uniref:probable ATP-dependent RNA helicase DDX27 n=1 Tax=Lytechinus variegatus TaxID=7654 RepID=UPI001BB299B7|nr:probable ATP-dependent RNA helicase DDX27 [Lytechinus variegatus]
MDLPFGLIGTIGEDDNVSIDSEESSSDEEAAQPKKVTGKQKKKAVDFSQDFEFTNSLSDDDDPWSADLVSHASSQRVSTSLEQKIAKIRRDRKKKEAEEKDKNKENQGDEKQEDGDDDDDDEDDDEEEDDEEEEEDDVQGFDDFAKWDKVKVKANSEKRLKRKKGEEEKPFFEELKDDNKALSFTEMNLSRPILRAVSGLNFTEPTPIQSATIPVALLGKDVCACAATGTGKTAAFILPVIERLLYKPKQAPVTRVLVLTPTRELGVQIFNVTRQLCEFTNIECCLAVGGLDIKLQEAALRKGPDIVIATPGRLIDHLHNAPTFSLGSVEVLILDEADRMLDEFFEEQMKEIIKMCSVARQTMLFSATMTDQVKDLAMVSLKNPVRIFVNENTDVAFNLQQEFIRIRENREGDREAIVSALCCRNFHDHCMVFVQTKKQAHRLHIILGLLGIKVGELHGDLSQAKRMEMLRMFKEDQIDILVATDLAARGLDIEGVKTVINFTMPNSEKHYVHRVGRTARAGRSGRSVSLAGEKERKMLKELVKRAKNPVKSRIIPQGVVTKYRDKIASLEEDIEEVLRLEKEEKEMRTTELQLQKTTMMLHNQKEFLNKPKRSWFQTHKERMQEKASLRLDAGTKPVASAKHKTKKKKKKSSEMTPEERVDFEVLKAQEYALRVAKRNRKPKRITAFPEDEPQYRTGPPPSKRQKKNRSQPRTSFEKELTSTSRSSIKQFRSKANEAKKMKERGKQHSKGSGKGKQQFKGKRR